MAEVQISQEEVKGIDINQVTSMQLKDGTVVVINPVEEQYDDQAGEEYVQEELPQEQKEVDECCQQGDQSNKLRARPMQYGVVPPRVKVVPAPIVQVPKVGVIPPNIRPPPKSMVARPPVVVPGYVAKPFLRPAVVPTPVAPLPVKPVPATVVRPVPSTLNKPLVSQMIQAPRFRAKPGTQEEEEFQEEEFQFEDYERIKEDFNLLYNEEYIKQINEDLLKLEIELFFEKMTELFSTYHLLMDEKILEKELIKREYNKNISNYLLYSKLNSKLQLLKTKKETKEYQLKEKRINFDKQNIENINLNIDELNIFKMVFTDVDKNKKLKKIISNLLKKKENKELINDKLKNYQK